MINVTSCKVQPIRLQDQIRLQFINACENMPRLPADPDDKTLVKAGMKMDWILRKDPAIVKAMADLTSGSKDYVLFENMPVDTQLCPTPLDGYRPKDKLTWTSELTLISLLTLGKLHPFSYLEEKGKELIHQVAPVNSMVRTRSNAGRIPLDWHTDNSIIDEEYRLDYLALLALVNEANTTTSIASVSKAYKLLPEKYRVKLFDIEYRVKSPDSFDKAFANKKIISEWKPLLNIDDEGRLVAAGNVYGVECKTRSAKAALGALGDALTAAAVDVVLRPGCLLIFNNNRVFHSRSEILGNRWLQRIFAKKDLDGIRTKALAGKHVHIFSARGLIL